MRKRILQLDSLTKFFIGALGVVTIAIVLKELQAIFLPFVIAYFIYFLFAPINELLKKIKIPSIIIVLINISIILAAGYTIGKFLIDSVLNFKDDFNTYSVKLSYIVQRLTYTLGINSYELKTFSIPNMIANLNYKELAEKVIGSSLDLMISLFFIVFFFIFIHQGHNGIYTAFKNRWVSNKKEADNKKNKDVHQITDESSNVESELTTIEIEEKLESTFRAIPEQIQKYVMTKIALNLMAALSSGVVLHLFKVDFAIIWALMVFILNFIPSIGAVIALLLPTLMVLIQYESIGTALGVAASMAVIQTIFFNLLEPVVIGKRLNLNPLIILLSVFVWGYIWGTIGMFLAVPLTAVIKIIISNSESKNMKFISDLMD